VKIEVFKFNDIPLTVVQLKWNELNCCLFWNFKREAINKKSFYLCVTFNIEKRW
jgi:hypothetical protein